MANIRLDGYMEVRNDVSCKRTCIYKYIFKLTCIKKEKISENTQSLTD
jgi:hypothetical protein